MPPIYQFLRGRRAMATAIVKAVLRKGYVTQNAYATEIPLHARVGKFDIVGVHHPHNIKFSTELAFEGGTTEKSEARYQLRKLNLMCKLIFFRGS